MPGNQFDSLPVGPLALKGLRIWDVAFNPLVAFPKADTISSMGLDLVVSDIQLPLLPQDWRRHPALNVRVCYGMAWYHQANRSNAIHDHNMRLKRKR